MQICSTKLRHPPLLLHSKFPFQLRRRQGVQMKVIDYLYYYIKTILTNILVLFVGGNSPHANSPPSSSSNTGMLFFKTYPYLILIYMARQQQAASPTNSCCTFPSQISCQRLIQSPTSRQIKNCSRSQEIY